RAPLVLASFPTRRSSDLDMVAQGLQRDPFLEEEILRLVDLAHAALAEGPHDLVSLADEIAGTVRDRTAATRARAAPRRRPTAALDRKSTRLNSSHVSISY